MESHHGLPAVIDLSGHASLASALGAAVERWPDSISLIELDRERENHRLTYKQFGDMAASFAGFLQASGFQPGTRVAIILTNQSKWLIAAYGVFIAGGVLVPLDPKLTAQEHRDLLAHSGSEWLIVEQHLPLRSGPKTIVIGAPPADDVSPARRWEDAAGGEARVSPRTRGDLACIVYSSGTGGRPKGCMLSHGNYLEQCAALAAVQRMAEGERYLSILPTNHAIDFMAGFIGPFVCGATVVHVRTLRPEFVRAALTSYGITHVTLVPMILKNLETALRAKLDALSGVKKPLTSALVSVNRAATRKRLRPSLSRRLLGPIHHGVGPSLRAIFVGGAFTDPATLQFFHDLGFPVANGYGLTEGCTVLTLNDLTRPRTDTVGTPLPGIEIRIVDADTDGVGQVAVSGPTVMTGYLDDPALTADTIRGRWLMTGDLGRVDTSGHLHLVGRVKNMIVTAGGKNVYPEDVEAAFDGVPLEEFCVFSASYLWRTASLSNDRLVGVLRFANNGGSDADTIAEFRRRNIRLPDYKRLGGYVRWTEAFPRTPSLKIKRDALADRLRAQLDAGAIADL